jgi:hypothetical protein
VQTYAGDTAISITWNDDPLVQYWLFYAQDPTVTPFDLDNGNTQLLNFGDAVPASSPSILCNSPQHTVINQSIAATSGFPAYYFTINGRTGTSKGGQGNAPVSAIPRPAASSRAPWVSGATIPVSVNGLGYVPLTSCGYSGLPPQGIFVAVGPSGVIYTSTLAPGVAGALTNPGNVPMTWTQAQIPLGFNSNLNAVAGRAASGNNPTNPNLLFAAVGDGGAIVRSFDGVHWQQSATVPTGSDLYSVAISTSGFIAVGQNGAVVTSPDGLNWTLNTSAQTANPSGSALRAIRCNGATCVAVGDSGTTLWSTNGGSSWGLLPFGTNNWIGVAYGNGDANSDAVFVNGAYILANEAINTWVVTDADGNYGFYNQGSGGTWLRGESIIAPGIVAIDYTSNFVALDSAGNAWISEQGSTGSWATYSAAPVTSNGANAIALRSNGVGYVALGAAGQNAASF